MHQNSRIFIHAFRNAAWVLQPDFWYEASEFVKNARSNVQSREKPFSAGHLKWGGWGHIMGWLGEWNIPTCWYSYSSFKYLGLQMPRTLLFCQQDLSSNTFTGCRKILWGMIHYKEVIFKDSKLFTSLWVPGTNRPWSLWVPEHWEWVWSLTFLYIGNLIFVPGSQVVSSWWVPSEFWWVYDSGRIDFGITASYHLRKFHNIKITRSHNCLISIIGILIVVRYCLYTELALITNIVANLVPVLLCHIHKHTATISQ